VVDTWGSIDVTVASFKRPILLPAEIDIRWLDEQSAGNEARAVRFEVRDARSGEPHMTGSVRG